MGVPDVWTAPSFGRFIYQFGLKAAIPGWREPTVPLPGGNQFSGAPDRMFVSASAAKDLLIHTKGGINVKYDGGRKKATIHMTAVLNKETPQVLDIPPEWLLQTGLKDKIGKNFKEGEEEEWNGMGEESGMGWRKSRNLFAGGGSAVAESWGERGVGERNTHHGIERKAETAWG